MKYLRDLGVYERVEERETTAQYQVTPVDLKWIDTNKASQRKPMQIRSRIVASEFKSEARPVQYAGTPPLEALKAIISIAAKSQTNILNHADRRVTFIFSCTSSETCAGTNTSEGQNGRRNGEMGLLIKCMYGTRDAASHGERDWQEHVKNCVISVGT